MTIFNIGDTIQVDTGDSPLIDGDIGIITGVKTLGYMSGEYHWPVEFTTKSNLYKNYGLKSLMLYEKNMKKLYTEINYDPTQQGDTDDDI